MNSWTFRTDERPFEMQPNNTITTADRTRRCDGSLYAFAGIRDQRRKTGRRAKPAMCARNRAHAIRRRLIVQKNAAAPIDLQIDKAGSKKGCPRKPCLRPIFRHLVPEPNSCNPSIPNHDRGPGMPAMAVEDTLRQDCVLFFAGRIVFDRAHRCPGGWIGSATNPI